MHKATAPGPASSKSGARQSLDVHAAASQPSRSETGLVAYYTPEVLLAKPLNPDLPDLQAQWSPSRLIVPVFAATGYCRPYTAMQPLALCVPQSPPACVGTKI
jgi:hypothetical protein